MVPLFQGVLLVFRVKFSCSATVPGCSDVLPMFRIPLFRVPVFLVLLYAMFDSAVIYESETIRSSHSKVFLRKFVLKICSKYAGENPCRSAISINLLCNFIEIALSHGCSPVNLLHIFRKPFPKNTSERLLLDHVADKLDTKCD